MFDFSVVQLTQAINVLPNKYSRVTDLGLFSDKPQTNTSVVIEMNNGVLTLVPTTAWGGVAPKSSSGKRNIRTFTIPHMPLEDTVLASEVIGVRQFGTLNVTETVASRVNEKLQTMKNKIDQTLEYRKMGALKGLVLDANGTDVIYDYFAEFGVTKKVIDFKFSVTTTDIRAACMSVLRHIEDNLQGELSSGVRALVSPEWLDAFTSHATVKAAYSNWSAAQNALGGDLRKGFTYGGITFEEYRGQVGGTKFVDASTGQAFPTGTSETFINPLAPADFIETVNTLALPYYARQQNKDFNRGIDLHVQANQLPLVARPATIVQLTMS